MLRRLGSRMSKRGGLGEEKPADGCTVANVIIEPRHRRNSPLYGELIVQPVATLTLRSTF